jgi:hypothetical protein
MFGQWAHFKLFSPKGNDYSMGRYTSEIKRLYQLLERRSGRRTIWAATSIPSRTSQRSRGRAIMMRRA